MSLLIASVTGFVVVSGSAAAVGQKGKLGQYEKAVADEMRDPSSVLFRRVHVVYRRPPQWPILCGELNAKNGFGGYVGFQRFFANIADGTRGVGAVVQMGDLAERMASHSADTATVCR